jgi:hypothetical protein
MLKRFKITAALTKAGVEFIDEDNGGRPRLRRRSRRAAKYYTPSAPGPVTIWSRAPLAA